MIQKMTLSLLVVFGATLLCPAREVFSGPRKGAKLPALKVHDCTGENKGKTVDHTEKISDKLAVVVLVSREKFSRPINRFMKSLDEKVSGENKHIPAVAVFFSEEDEKTREFLQRVQTSVNYETMILTSYKGKDGPKDWNINPDVLLTVVLAKEGKVLTTFAFNSVNEADVPEVFKQVMKAAEK